jgi:uncharacterized membrane protein
MMNRMTTLGLDERIERVLAYALFWLSGVILFLIEKNRNVRWHAAQSMLTFGTLSLISLAVSLLNAILGRIPLLGWLVSPGLGFLSYVLWWVTIILWVLLMVMAWVRPDFRLPYISKWVDRWV